MDEPRQSLIDRMTERLAPQPGPPPPERRRAMPKIDWRFVAALIGLIAMGPLLTIIGARLLEADALAAVARLRGEVAPRAAAAARDGEARRLLREAVHRPPVAVWLDRLASALPADARVGRMTLGADGATEIEIATPDPDQLRAALRRHPVMSGFREVGQRRDDALVLVTWRRTA
jgi:hypothetical protein